MGWGEAVKKLFKNRPGKMAAEANKEQKGMSKSQKKWVSDFTASFSGTKVKKDDDKKKKRGG